MPRLHPAQTSQHDVRMAGKTGVAVNFAQRPQWLVKRRDGCRLNDFSVGHANWRTSP